MKKSLLTLAIFALGFGLFSTSADTKTLTLNKSFSELETSAGVNVIYKPSTTGNATVTITGDAKRIEQVDVRMKGNTLMISPKRNANGNRQGSMVKGVLITVTAPVIGEIEASSGSSVKCSTPISSPNRKFEFDASSGATISFTSIACRSIEIDASSGADVNVKELKATKADLEASSGASVTVTSATNTSTSCEASSGGSVKIAGTSEKGYFEASSGGSISASSFNVRNARIEKSISGSIKVNSK